MTASPEKPQEPKKPRTFGEWIDKHNSRLTLMFYAIGAITNIVSIILLIKAIKN